MPIQQFAVLCLLSASAFAQESLTRQAIKTMQSAGGYYSRNAATNGGYVYHYSLDFKQRWGEGLASETQIWVQPPGTPTVGRAFLKAYLATNDPRHLNSALNAANALMDGQVVSGAWTNSVDFDSSSQFASQYRHGKGNRKGRAISSLDDDQSCAAMRFLIELDGALEFNNERVHEAAGFALESLLKVQYPNGAFPQVWDEELYSRHPDAIKNRDRVASFPDYDWRSEGRVKNYWDMYTLNDNVAGTVCDTLILAYKTYGDERFLAALKRLGDFLIAAQMPEPQPGWAQQYNYEMKPIWARRFEPAAVAGDETQEAIATLLRLYQVTKDERFLKPIPAAIEYLRRSELPDGQMARYYELKTNRPLYMERQGKVYTLTYNDDRLPSHYGWKVSSRWRSLTKSYEDARSGRSPIPHRTNEREVKEIIAGLDDKGRWTSHYKGERLVGQPKFKPGQKYLSSQRFADNMNALSRYLIESR